MWLDSRLGLITLPTKSQPMPLLLWLDSRLGLITLYDGIDADTLTGLWLDSRLGLITLLSVRVLQRPSCGLTAGWD